MEDQNSTNSIESQSDSVFKMDSSIENIDPAVLQEAGDTVEMSGEWSVTASALNSSDSSSNPCININTLKECCDDSSDILNEKNEFVVVESTVTKCSADESKNLTMCKTSAFQKKHKTSFSNLSRTFENIFDDDSQIENSIYLSRFQKRKRLLPPNEEDFVEINKSDYNEMDSIDASMKFSKNKFKHPSKLSLTNASIDMNESKTEVFSHKFTRRTIDLVNSAFENVIDDSSMTSSIVLNNKNTTLNETSVSNLNRNSPCGTEEIPSLNHTYNVPVNSTQVGLLSQSIKMYSELSNIEQPINGTYLLENELMSSESLNAKNTLSDTYTVENNLNDTSSQLKSGLKSKTASTLTDMSNIYNQSKSSVRKPNFMRKLQLDEGSQEYNITIYGDNNSTVNNETNQEENNKFKRFKLNKIQNDDGNSIHFDNIITNCERNETSATDTISKTFNASIDTSTNNDFINITPVFTLKENVKESINKSSPQLSTMHQNEFVENDKNISNPSPMLKSNKSNSFSQRSSKFNFSKQFGSLSLSYHEKTCHNLTVPQNTTFMLSQSHSPHFVITKNLNVNSGVFNDIIDNNSDSNMSLNDSKELKFKNHKIIFEGDSIMFENVISNSQESNSTFTQNKTLRRSVVYDQSKIQASDEISLYANANDLSFDEKSSRNSCNSIKKQEISKILNLEETNHPEDELESSEISACLSKHKNDSYSYTRSVVSSIADESNSAVPNIIDEISENNKLSKSKLTRLSSVSVNNSKSSSDQVDLDIESMVSDNNLNNVSSQSSKNVTHSNTKNDDNENDDSIFSTTATGYSTDSRTSNNMLASESLNNIRKLSTSMSKQTNNSSKNDMSTKSNIIDKLPENNKSCTSKLTRLSSVSVNNSKSSSDQVDLDIESLVSDNNVNNVSSQSSKYVTHSNTDNEDETHDSIFLTTATGYSTDSRTSNNMLASKSLNSIHTLSSSVLKQTNNSSKNDLSTKSNIIDKLPENNKSCTSKLTRLSSVSMNNKKSPSDQVDLDIESMVSDNNLNNVSSQFSKNVTHSNTENDSKKMDDSIFWTTVSECSTDSKKTSNNIVSPETLNNIGTISTTKSKQISNSFANDLSVESNIIDEFPENNKSCISKLTGLSSVSVNNSKCSSDQVDLDIESLVSDNNVNNLSSQSLKNVSHSNTENYNNKTDDSIFWTTVSGYSIDSKTSNNMLASKSLNNIHTVSASMSKQTNNSSKNDLSTKSNIIDKLPKNNKSCTPKVTRLSSVSMDSNKSSSDQVDLDIESMVSDNNLINVSSQSSKNVTHSNTENDNKKIDDSILWTTVSECSTDSRKKSNNILSPEALINIDTISTSKSKQISNSFVNDLSVESSIIDELPNTNKPYSTRVTRSSSKYAKNNKSLVSVNNTKHLSNRSSRGSKDVAHSNVENFNGTDDSMDWTTVPDNSSSELPIQNEFQTPKNNKLAIKERIINVIGIMSANKQKSTHPGVFELEENGNRVLTRSIAQLSNHSPSILTKVLVTNNDFESVSSFTENISINQSEVENNVKEKFKSLYNKESWITKRLYNFLVSKLQLKYGIYSVKYAEKFVKYLASILKRVNWDKLEFQLYTDMLRYHMARYGIIEDTSDYLRFLTDYIPKPYYDKLMPGWNLETSDVKFDPLKYYIPIMEDEEFLKIVLENLNAT